MGQGDAVATLGSHGSALDRTVRIRLAWSALALVAAVTAAWFRTGRRYRPSSDPGRRQAGHDEDCGRADCQIDPAGGDPSFGPDEPQRDLKPLIEEDLPPWKVVIRAWGGFGLCAAVVALGSGVWLAGEHSDHLLRLINLLIGPCAVLISVSILSITFAGNWEMTPCQAKRRDDVIVHSYVLVTSVVLAIAFAGIYAAVAPASDGSALLHAGLVKGIGATAAWFLALSLFGMIGQALRIIKLIKYQNR